jgi:hypothetical protein
MTYVTDRNRLIFVDYFVGFHLVRGLWSAMSRKRTHSLIKKCAGNGAGLQRVQLPPGNRFVPPGRSNRDVQ